MDKVFVSYAREDADFADRLTRDLQTSEVLATYDKWLLRVGDSIVQKILTEVSEADRVVALLSRASVTSTWVKKELALAMTAELNGAATRVLPVLLEDCDIPPMLADKLLADCRTSYFAGLRQLLEALLPSATTIKTWLLAKEQIEAAREEYLRLLATRLNEAVRRWLSRNRFVVAELAGTSGTDVVADVPAGDDTIDFVTMSFTSDGFWILLIALGDIDSDLSAANMRHWSGRLHRMVDWCAENKDELMRRLAARIGGSFADQFIDRTSNLECAGTLLLGRRAAYDDAANELRKQVRVETSSQLRIYSYDRVVTQLEHSIGIWNPSDAT